VSGFVAVLANPVVGFLLRAALGAYIVYMARGFYADPFGYFRRWMPGMPEHPLVRETIRGLAAFCVWGGCFIVATAIATQIFGLHGIPLLIALITVALIATWLLLPKQDDRGSRGEAWRGQTGRGETGRNQTGRNQTGRNQTGRDRTDSMGRQK
jgi:hypothetical protein